jgi:hypothetical protein
LFSAPQLKRGPLDGREQHVPDWLIGLFAIAAAITLWVVVDFLPGPVQARLEPDGIRIRLLGFVPLLHIPLDQIADIRRESWAGVPIGDLLRALRLGVTVFRKPVLIERVGRAPVLLAPRHPDAFVREVRQRLALPAV